MALLPMERDADRQCYSGTVNVPAIPVNGYAEVTLPRYTNNLVCTPLYYANPKDFNCMIRSQGATSYVVRVSNTLGADVPANTMKLCWIQA